MFEYSVSPFYVLSDTHRGFIFSVVCLFLYFLFFIDVIEEFVYKIKNKMSVTSFNLTYLAPILVVVFVGIKSWETDDVFDCTAHQEKVVASLVAFSPEVFKERHGKQDIVKHKVYAQYNYNNDNFLFEVAENGSVPKHAYFYRIDVKKYPKCSKVY